MDKSVAKPFKTVDVLGQEYKIYEMTEKEYPKLKVIGANGLFEAYSKEIIISKDLNLITDETYEKLHLLADKVLRHELIHAFFHESGLNDYCEDETLVDWLAHQLPKMVKVMDKLNIL